MIPRSRTSRGTFDGKASERGVVLNAQMMTKPGKTGMAEIYNRSSDEVLEAQEVDADSGLSDAEVKEASRANMAKTV